MNSKKHMFALIATMALITGLAQAGVVFFDDFDHGGRKGWYNLDSDQATLSVSNSAPVNGTAALAHVSPGSQEIMLSFATHFNPVVLSNENDSITLQFDAYRFGTGFVNRGLRFGLYDSNGSKFVADGDLDLDNLSLDDMGFNANVDNGSSTAYDPAQLRQEDVVTEERLWSGQTLLKGVAGGDSLKLMFGRSITYTYFLTLTRNAVGGIDIEMGNNETLGGTGGLSYTVHTPSTTTFDTIYFGMKLPALPDRADWYLDNVQVTSNVEPMIEVDKGYYKDLFMDGGVNLTSRTTLPAAELLGLSMEYIATGDVDEQNDFMVQMADGSWQDDNGALLYPDGEPRFSCMYVNGGRAGDHGSTLEETGLDRIRNFYRKGGGYTGSCAGAFLANMVSSIDSNAAPNPLYLHIWPAKSQATRLAASRTGHTIPADSPLLDYYDFGGDNYVASVYHNGGGFVIEDDANYWYPGTEVLSTFAGPIVGSDPDYRDFMGHVSAYAYKEDAESGRIVVCYSHPEGEVSGERRDWQAAFLAYAIDGDGDPAVKAALANGVERQMNDNGTAGHEKIGDLQYHHFTVDVPAETDSLMITLDGDDAYDLDLFVRLNGFAFKGLPNVEYAANESGSDESITITAPEAGTWYIGVKCATTVVSAQGDTPVYSGDLGVLNGVAYSIKAEWIFDTNDSDAPTPYEAAFASVPTAISDAAISMTAVTGTDINSVLYLFTETSGGPGGTSSGWQSSPTYTDTGLRGSVQYTYTVTMRDVLGNTGLASAPSSATTQDEVPALLSQSGYTLLYVDSEETAQENAVGSNAFDGDDDTYWSTQRSGAGSPTHPHEIQIDLGHLYSVSELRYLPRQDAADGRIADYEFYVSMDGLSWGTAVASGTFQDTAEEQVVSFATVPARYVRLVALSGVYGTSYTTVAEINIIGTRFFPPVWIERCKLDGTDMLLQISGYAGYSYALQKCDSLLTDNWIPVGTPHQVSGSPGDPVTFEMRAPISSSNCFYRVRAD